jgi:hypothetical protein
MLFRRKSYLKRLIEIFNTEGSDFLHFLHANFWIAPYIKPLPALAIPSYLA